MTGRRLALLLSLPALALGGCTRDAATTTAAAPSVERQRLLRFWDRFSAATASRIGHDFAKARDLYREALTLDPKHEDSLYYLGQCQRELKEPAEARQAFERLVDVNPASTRGHLALGALLASPDASEPMDVVVAEKHFRRAHEINGEETGPMVRLGEVLMLQGKLREAGRWFESALRTNPKSVEAPFLMGYLTWETGDPGGALRFAQGARDAAKVQAPVRGVLNEGDRKDPKFVAAPPLTSPMGRMLFGELAGFVREAARAGRGATDTDFVAAWRSVRQARREYERRVAAGRPS